MPPAGRVVVRYNTVRPAVEPKFSELKKNYSKAT